MLIFIYRKMSDKQYLLSDDKLISVVEMLIKHATTKEMKSLLKTNSVMYHKILNETHKEFSLTYPGLFNTIVDEPEKFDINRLKQMLEMKKKVNQNKLTYEEASTKIGQQYYDEFAKPLVDKIHK